MLIILLDFLRILENFSKKFWRTLTAGKQTTTQIIYFNHFNLSRSMKSYTKTVGYAFHSCSYCVLIVEEYICHVAVPGGGGDGFMWNQSSLPPGHHWHSSLHQPTLPLRVKIRRLFLYSSIVLIVRSINIAVCLSWARINARWMMSVTQSLGLSRWIMIGQAQIISQ